MVGTAIGVGWWVCRSGIWLASRADSALSRSFLYRAPRGAALDILFGPEQHFEYESTTTP